MVSMSHDTRERLVRRGVELLTEYSFNATGLDPLLQSVGVTKGSFYHFFGSKQAFTLEVIAWYEAYFERRFQRILGDETRPPLERLRVWMDHARRGMARHGYRRGCLVGNLSQELGPHDQVLRERLQAVFGAWEGRVSRLLEQARAAGELPGGADTAALARLFWCGWEGAILRAKLEGDGRPLQEFAAYFLCLASQAKAVVPASPARAR